MGHGRRKEKMHGNWKMKKDKMKRCLKIINIS
jgi:hypothetical protein